MATYSINNFLGTPVSGDKMLKIYDINRKLVYQINPNISYFFTQSDIVIIRIVDSNDIHLDFSSNAEAAAAALKLNDARKEMVRIIAVDGLSDKEQRRLAYFHALSKTLLSDSQKLEDSKYKSSHNVKLSETWATEILPCQTYDDVISQISVNSAITLHTQVTLTAVSGSNDKSWYYKGSGDRFVRPWIGPQDIPFPITNLPSDGFELLLFRGDDATNGIPGSRITNPILLENFVTLYYNGMLYFTQGISPLDLGWGTIKATFFEYTGAFGMANAFNTVVFDSDTGMLIFNQGTSSEESVLIPGAAPIGGLASTNVDMDANTTTLGGNGELACDTTLNTAPLIGSHISVYVNGVQVSVGNGVKTNNCYFSSNGGISAKYWVNIQIGDSLYWNGEIAGYNLNSLTDKISFIYLKE